jgi:hypothetical protein
LKTIPLIMIMVILLAADLFASESEPNHYKLVTRDYLEARIETLNVRLERIESLLDINVCSIKESVDRAKLDLDYRLQGMDASTFATKVELQEAKNDHNFFATKESVEKMEMFVYVGLGIVIAIQFIVGILLATMKVWPSKRSNI